MLRSTIRMIVSSEKQCDVLEILASISEQTQFAAGCVSSRLYRGIEDSRSIMLDEIWLSLEDLQRHLRSDKYREVLLAVEMASEPPEIRFDTIAESSGVETIERARARIDQ